MGVAGVEETGKAEVFVGAVAEVKAFGSRGAGDAIEVGDAVEGGDVARAVELIEYSDGGEVGGAGGEVKVVGIAAARATNSYMATSSAAEILAEI